MNEEVGTHASARKSRPPNFEWLNTGNGNLVQNNPFLKYDLNSRRASSAAIWLDDLRFGLQHINQMGEIIISPKKYQLMLDVTHFRKPELQVRANSHAFFVQAAHNVPKEGHNYVTEHFYREYVLPKAIRPHDVCGFLTPENILVIEAPKVTADKPKDSGDESACSSPEPPVTHSEGSSESSEDGEEVRVPIIMIDALEQIIPV